MGPGGPRGQSSYLEPALEFFRAPAPVTAACVACWAFQRKRPRVNFFELLVRTRSRGRGHCLSPRRHALLRFGPMRCVGASAMAPPRALLRRAGCREKPRLCHKVTLVQGSAPRWRAHRLSSGAFAVASAAWRCRHLHQPPALPVRPQPPARRRRVVSTSSSAYLARCATAGRFHRPGVLTCGGSFRRMLGCCGPQMAAARCPRGASWPPAPSG